MVDEGVLAYDEAWQLKRVNLSENK
jgi:hypothetical protein